MLRRYIKERKEKVLFCEGGFHPLPLVSPDSVTKTMDVCVKAL